MCIKKSLLVVFLLCNNNSVFSSEKPSIFSWEWLTSWLGSQQQPIPSTKKDAFKKAVTTFTTSGKPLDLSSFYRQKETKSIVDPIKSAEKFKKAIEIAAENSPLMKRFKDTHQFLFGASSSSYQYEGGLDSNNANAIFYQQKGLEQAGIAIDFWNRYTTDIPQMETELGINSFRLSISWERIQPSKDTWDLSMLAQYIEIIKLLKKHNIEPIVVFHHYTIPQWFAEIGGFEKYQNIKHFVTFAQKMYETLHEHVIYWSTFNAIEGYAFKGYYTLDGPPGKQKSLLKTQEVMYNMLAAHAQVYKTIKARYREYKKENNDTIAPMIGIQKNIVLLDPYDRRFSTRFITTFGTALQNKMIFSLLYNRYYNAIDWIGVNIYSNMFMLGTVKQQEEEEQRKTENDNYRDYPEGIYRAVKIVHDSIAKPLNIPIIITENGIATKNDDPGEKKRARFFQRALYTIRKLIEEGYPIIGYTPWASHDNYEWPSKTQSDPYSRPYGMFKVNFDKNSPDYLKRGLKEGAQYYRDFIKEYFKNK